MFKQRRFAEKTNKHIKYWEKEKVKERERAGNNVKILISHKTEPNKIKWNKRKPRQRARGTADERRNWKQYR